MPVPDLNTATSSPHSAVTPMPRPGAAVRPFCADDIPEVIRLHRAAFHISQPPDLAAYRQYFKSVFLENPANGQLPSLVYEEPGGRLAGFIGVVPRRVTMAGRRYLAAISSQFVVDPASRVGLVALRLVKAYFEGPQDLSIADEANERSRAIWEGLGGRTALLLSIYWTRPLRPARLAADRLRQRRGFRPLGLAATPLAAGADMLAARLPGSYFRQLPSDLSASELSAATLLPHTGRLRDANALNPEYDEETLQWLLDRAAVHSREGRLLTAVLREGRAVVGWYICVLERDGTADVAQLVATPESVHRVLDHLFYTAWRHGAVAVTGRLEPRYMQALSDKYCLFHRRGPWVLVRTGNPDLLRAFEVGNTDFSRLDGEWALRYDPPSVWTTLRQGAAR